MVSAGEPTCRRIASARLSMSLTGIGAACPARGGLREVDQRVFPAFAATGGPAVDWNHALPPFIGISLARAYLGGF